MDIDSYKKIPLFGHLIGWMDENDMDYAPVVLFVSITLFALGLFLFGVTRGNIASAFFFLAPIWLPVILFFVFFEKWMDMVGKSFYLYNGRTTMRINLPPEVLKSPEAMEFVLAQIHNTANADNYMQTYLQGKRPLTYGLELVSIGGDVRFYVNTPTKKTRDAFEANIYAQYPGVEIVEEPVDYAAEIPLDYSDDEYATMAFHMGKKADEEFPVKTYIDFGLDKMPKEEEKVDPMTPMLEVLASITEEERVYIQFICTSHAKKGINSGQLKSEPTWEKRVYEKIDEIMHRDPETRGPLVDPDEEEFSRGAPRITSGERDTVEAMERNVEKYAYHVGIRWLYMAKVGSFNGDRINPIIRSFSQVDKIGRNQIGVKWRTDFDYKDLIPGGKKKALNWLKRQELKEYKLRKYVQKGDGDGQKIFSVEELATLFHLPGKVLLTPTVSRIQSTRSEAPSNLPTGN